MSSEHASGAERHRSRKRSWALGAVALTGAGVGVEAIFAGTSPVGALLIGAGALNGALALNERRLERKSR